MTDVFFEAIRKGNVDEVKRLLSKIRACFRKKMREAPHP